MKRKLTFLEGVRSDSQRKDLKDGRVLGWQSILCAGESVEKGAKTAEG